MTDISELNGKTIESVSAKIGDDEIIFVCADGSRYRMYHKQDCCESVDLEDICGDIEDLQNALVISAEESTSDQQQNGQPEHADSFTWTFYKIQTNKGAVTLRWLGTSNGCYSEYMNFDKVES